MDFTFKKYAITVQKYAFKNLNKNSYKRNTNDLIKVIKSRMLLNNQIIKCTNKLIM